MYIQYMDCIRVVLAMEITYATSTDLDQTPQQVKERDVNMIRPTRKFLQPKQVRLNSTTKDRKPKKKELEMRINKNDTNALPITLYTVKTGHDAWIPPSTCIRRSRVLGMYDR